MGDCGPWLRLGRVGQDRLLAEGSENYEVGSELRGRLSAAFAPDLELAAKSGPKGAAEPRAFAEARGLNTENLRAIAL